MKKAELRKRFKPLYIAAFFQGFVLWYAIEKLFMVEIGFNNATIAVAAAVVGATTLIAEFPSGILADRWSRKGVLGIASLALMLCSLFCGLSTSTMQLTLAVSLWGVFYAMYSGTYDAIIYDTLLEETGSANDYKHYLGHVKILDSLALIMGSLVGSLIASEIGLRPAYILSVALIGLSLVAILRFREPKLHRQQPETSLMKHTSATIKAVAKRGQIGWIVVSMVLVFIAIRLTFEFNQLWYIAVNLPVAYYGVVHAFVQSSNGLGGWLAKFFSGSLFKSIILSLVLIISSAMLLQNSIAWIVIGQVVTLSGLLILGIVLSHLLHDALPSSVRAGSTSAVSSLSNLFFVPVAILFGGVAEGAGIFKAGWAIVSICVAITLLMWVISRNQSASVTWKQ